MKQISNDSKILSSAIEVLRFPLAVGVIFIHMEPSVVNLVDAKYSLLSHEGLFNLLGITLSHVLTHIAVPCFFLISGLLFFLNIKEWNWTEYRRKLKSRVTTLLIPYIAWNVTPWLLAVLYLYIKAYSDNSLNDLVGYINRYNIDILYNCHQWGGERVDWLGNNLLMTGPYDLPLWFLRDLIFMTILTPIIYLFIKKFKLWYIAVLFIAYISRIWILTPGLHITACFFFSLGAFFSLNNINVISIVKKYRYRLVSLSIILLAISVVYDGTNTVTGQNIYPFFIITAVFVVFYIASLIVQKYNIMSNELLLSACFFIYAFHMVSLPIIGSPLGFCNRILNYILPDFPIVKYLAAPFLTVIVCILIMQIGKRLLPDITKWYTGNR